LRTVLRIPLLLLSARRLPGEPGSTPPPEGRGRWRPAPGCTQRKAVRRRATKRRVA